MICPVNVERTEDCARTLPVEKVRIGKVAERAGGQDFLVNSDEPLRILIGQGFDKGGIHKGENGYAGAHTECQHENRDASEAGILAELTEGKADVSKEIFERGKRGPLTIGFLGAFDASELDKGFAAGLPRSHASANVFVCVELEVRLDFI
jgi:hypothetical protein